MALAPLDPHVLVESSQAAVRSPMWFVYFIQFFKALGFTLHAMVMSLWYAGLPLAVALYGFGSCRCCSSSSDTVRSSIRPRS